MGEPQYKMLFANDMKDIIWQAIYSPSGFFASSAERTYNPSHSRVPIFCTLLIVDQILVNLIVLIIGSIFGAIHCLA